MSENKPEYKNETPVKKELNIKRSFFVEGAMCPSFELESGEVKTPIYMNSVVKTPAGFQMVCRLEYYTEAEWKVRKAEIDRQNDIADKKKHQPKLININGKKLGN
jgi:hypothetical protein